MATAAEFLEQNQQDGMISPEKMEELLSGGFEFEGHGKDPDAKDEPEVKAESEKAAPEAAEEPEAKPVIMAKDGVHTIEYEKLEEARQEAQEAKAQLAALTQQNQEMAGKLATLEEQFAAAQKVDVKTGTDDATRQLIEEAREMEPELVKAFEAMQAAERATYKAELDARDQKIAALTTKVESELEPIKAAKQGLDVEKHFSSIRQDVPEFDAIMAGEDLAKFVESKPSFVRNGYVDVLQRGTAAQVVELMNDFKGSTFYKPPAGETAGKVKPEKEIEVKKSPPVSLSEMPAGTQAHGDPADALANSSGIGILSALEGKSKEEVDRLVNRALRMKV